MLHRFTNPGDLILQHLKFQLETDPLKIGGIRGNRLDSYFSHLAKNICNVIKTLSPVMNH